jgi:hypothetical protein
MRSFVLCAAHQILLGCSSEFGDWGSCGTYWREKYIQSFGGETRRKQTLENLGVDGTIILKRNFNESNR